MKARLHFSRALLASLLFLSPVLAQTDLSEPSVPKLDDVDVPPGLSTDTEPARALPVTVTLCRSVKDRQCWSGGEGGECTTSDHADGAEFRIVIKGPDVLSGLKDCTKSLQESPTPARLR